MISIFVTANIVIKIFFAKYCAVQLSTKDIIDLSLIRKDGCQKVKLLQSRSCEQRITSIQAPFIVHFSYFITFKSSSVPSVSATGENALFKLSASD